MIANASTTTETIGQLRQRRTVIDAAAERRRQVVARDSDWSLVDAARRQVDTLTDRLAAVDAEIAAAMEAL